MFLLIGRYQYFAIDLFVSIALYRYINTEYLQSQCAETENNRIVSSGFCVFCTKRYGWIYRKSVWRTASKGAHFLMSNQLLCME